MEQIGKGGEYKEMKEKCLSNKSTNERKK
uniref:Uncharacterized protein n=1 Tax=Rhizophora mucronata TaxID=61149 RepID=A0A2P2N724_RHIMU